MTPTAHIDTLARTAAVAAEHGDLEYAAALTLLDRWIGEEAHTETVESDCTVVVADRIRLSPADVVAVARRIESGRVEVSPTGESVVSTGRPGEWIELDSAE